VHAEPSTGSAVVGGAVVTAAGAVGGLVSGDVMAVGAVVVSGAAVLGAVVPTVSAVVLTESDDVVAGAIVPDEPGEAVDDVSASDEHALTIVAAINPTHIVRNRAVLMR
jgi:hypothetical protein